jgi:hypothetical protein
MAAKTGQPAISPDSEWAAKTAGSKPTVSMSLRGTPAGRPSPGRAPSGTGISLHVSDAGQRGSAPSRRIRIFLLRASGLRRVVCAFHSQSVPEILQPILPSGFAPGDRARTAMATTSAAGSAATAARPVPRALSWLTGIFHGHAQAYASFAPQKEEGAGRSRDRSGPPAPFLRFRTSETGR